MYRNETSKKGADLTLLPHIPKPIFLNRDSNREKKTLSLPKYLSFQVWKSVEVQLYRIEENRIE